MLLFTARFCDAQSGFQPASSGPGEQTRGGYDPAPRHPTISTNAAVGFNPPTGEDFGGIFGFDRGTTPLEYAFDRARRVPPSDFYRLCASIVACAVAFFFLYQSVAVQRMATKDREDVPEPQSGVGVAWFVFWCIAALACFYWIAGHPEVFNHPPPYLWGAVIWNSSTNRCRVFACECSTGCHRTLEVNLLTCLATPSTGLAAQLVRRFDDTRSECHFHEDRGSRE